LHDPLNTVVTTNIPRYDEENNHPRGNHKNINNRYHPEGITAARGAEYTAEEE
jgi:hypothetical protein